MFRDNIIINNDVTLTRPYLFIMTTSQPASHSAQTATYHYQAGLFFICNDDPIIGHNGSKASVRLCLQNCLDLSKK